MKQQLEELSISTLDEARVALEDSLALIKSIHANDGVFRQYESLKKHCEETEIQLDLLSRGREVILNQIQEKRKQWENPLRNFVAKINIKFGQYMQEMGCTGEVRLKRGQDGETDSSQSSRQSESDFANFKEWGIEILVSYRDNTKAQILSAQHHSGGERSVATILYLMALQDMMVAPFRCVDEINQGLDERNERLVFNRIVMNSTNLPRGNALNHSGQYFLITPKLLPNLTGMENEGVTVHIIFNGKFTARMCFTGASLAKLTPFQALFASISQLIGTLNECWQFRSDQTMRLYRRNRMRTIIRHAMSRYARFGSCESDLCCRAFSRKMYCLPTGIC